MRVPANRKEIALRKPEDPCGDDIHVKLSLDELERWYAIAKSPTINDTVLAAKLEDAIERWHRRWGDRTSRRRDYRM